MVIVTDYGAVRPPDPAVFVCIVPTSISIEVFGAPKIIVVILDVIVHALRKIALAVINPCVQGISGISSRKFPIAGVWSIVNKFSGAAVAQNKTRRLGINARASTIARR